MESSRFIGPAPSRVVLRHFARIAPPGVPPAVVAVVAVVWAEARGAGRDRSVVARVVMADEARATVEVRRFAGGRNSHSFLASDDPRALSYENRAWVRVEEPACSIPTA